MSAIYGLGLVVAAALFVYLLVALQHHYLRVYMAQLRHKIEKDPARPRHLVTEPGVGYRLRDD